MVLAGGKAKPDLAAATGQTNRAQIVVNGKALLRHVVDALLSAEAPAPITVIGDVPASADYACLPDSGDFVENMFAGLSAYSDAAFVLIATSDLPFLTGEAVSAFVRGALTRAEETGAGFIWPVVPVASCYARFPGIRRTALRLREGEYTGGNLGLARPRFLLAHRKNIAQAYAARKSPLRIAWLLGLGTLGRLLLSQKVAPGLLTIPLVEGKVSRLMGGPVRALVCDYPEIATDLDRPSDFAAIGYQKDPDPKGKS